MNLCKSDPLGSEACGIAEKGLALIAHPTRRASFSATMAELEEKASKGYEATVEDFMQVAGSPRRLGAASARHPEG